MLSKGPQGRRRYGIVGGAENIGTTRMSLSSSCDLFGDAAFANVKWLGLVKGPSACIARLCSVRLRLATGLRRVCCYPLLGSPIFCIERSPSACIQSSRELERAELLVEVSYRLGVLGFDDLEAELEDPEVPCCFASSFAFEIPDSSCVGDTLSLNESEVATPFPLEGLRLGLNTDLKRVKRDVGSLAEEIGSESVLLKDSEDLSCSPPG